MPFLTKKQIANLKRGAVDEAVSEIRKDYATENIFTIGSFFPYPINSCQRLVQPSKTHERLTVVEKNLSRLADYLGVELKTDPATLEKSYYAKKKKGKK